MFEEAGGEQQEWRNKMEGRIEKHTLSSGQDIERRETNTSRPLKREGRLLGTAMHARVSKLPNLSDQAVTTRPHTIHLITLNTSS